MSRITKAISQEMLANCKIELKKHPRGSQNGRKLQAIISASKYGISKVSKIYNISRETLMRWIRKFKEHGIKGFAVQPGRGRPSKLQDNQKLELKQYIMTEGATLTAKRLRLLVEERYDVKISDITALRLLKRLGFAYITPRPSHHKKVPKSQEEFKKKS